MTREKSVRWFANPDMQVERYAEGHVLMASNWGRRYVAWCRQHLPGASHMRVGRFSVTCSGDDWNMIAAECYPAGSEDRSIKRGSKYWEASKRDRLSQLNRINSFLTNDHPLFAELNKYILAERAYLK